MPNVKIEYTAKMEQIVFLSDEEINNLDIDVVTDLLILEESIDISVFEITRASHNGCNIDMENKLKTTR